MTTTAPGSALRVLYVHRTRGLGVERVHIEGICAGLRRRGFEVTMVAPAVSANDTGTRRGLRARFLAWLSAEAPEILFELAELAHNLPAGRRLRTLLRAADVSFVYERYAIFAFCTALIAARSRLPLVLEVNYTARSPLLRRRSRLLEPLAVALDRFIFRRATLLLAVSSVLRDQLIRDYDVPAARILLTPNAADPQRFDPSIAPVSEAAGHSLEGRRVIGFVGTFAPWHGLDLLLRAFAIAAARLPQAVLLLIGDGPERERIARLAARDGLADRVLFAGPVDHESLARYVARFDAAVLPDTNEYGSPMKIFEYMAMARPVIAPDYGPVLDVIRHGHNGLIFARGDPQALAGCLIELFASTGEAQRLGAAARSTIENGRTWLHNVDAMLGALRQEHAQRLGLARA